ncbi:hypothetical protein GW17_00049090 [Ensete ventricosum]|nr:hypothetical protein GW17_00049090 [Ensete ventricosum]
MLVLALRRALSPRPTLQKGRLLIIEPIKAPEHEEEDLKPEEDIKEDPQLVDCTAHALVGYVNSQTMKVEGFLKQQVVTILIDIGSTNNFVNNMVVALLTLWNKDYIRFSVMVVDGRILNTTYCLLCSLVEHSYINPKSLVFDYLDEKFIDTGLMKFLGLCPFVLSWYLEFASTFSTSSTPFTTNALPS